MKSPKPRSTCPISFSLDVLGDRWTLLILRDMIFAGKSTYGEFLQSPEKVATNILADRLATLEAQGLVTKQVAADKKSKFTYRLTEKGLDLLPLLLELIQWGSTYNPAGGDSAVRQEVAADKEATLRRYRQLVQSRQAG
jgi:DNA-binding HxlR family transcriptional regulator